MDKYKKLFSMMDKSDSNVGSEKERDRRYYALKWARQIARGAGMFWVAVGFVLVLGYAASIGYLASESENPNEIMIWVTADDKIMLLLIMVVMIGVFAALWSAPLGGSIMVLSGVALAVFRLFASDSNNVLEMLLWGGPVLIIGILHLAVWRMEQPRWQVKT